MCCYLECVALRLKSNQYSFFVELVDEYAVLPTSLNCREFIKEISVNTRLHTTLKPLAVELPLGLPGVTIPLFRSGPSRPPRSHCEWRITLLALLSIEVVQMGAKGTLLPMSDSVSEKGQFQAVTNFF